MITIVSSFDGYITRTVLVESLLDLLVCMMTYSPQHVISNRNRHDQIPTYGSLFVPPARVNENRTFFVGLVHTPYPNKKLLFQRSQLLFPHSRKFVGIVQDQGKDRLFKTRQYYHISYTTDSFSELHLPSCLV